MTQISLDQLSDRINGPILHYPGRRFPGVLIQGDTLYGFVMMAEAVVEALGQRDLQNARDEAEELRDKLRAHLDHYVGVLRDHGMPVPFLKSHAMRTRLRKAKGSRSSSKRTYIHNFPSCSRTYATLLIFHAAMQPEQIAAVLGVEPDDTGRRGDPAGLGRKVPRNFWAKGTYDRYESRDVRFHIDKILTGCAGRRPGFACF